MFSKLVYFFCWLIDKIQTYLFVLISVSKVNAVTKVNLFGRITFLKSSLDVATWIVMSLGLRTGVLYFLVEKLIQNDTELPVQLITHKE